MTRFLDRLLEWPDDVLAAELQLAVLMRPAVEVLAQSAPSDGHVVSVNQVVFEQIRQDFCEIRSGIQPHSDYIRSNALGIPPIL